MKPFITSNNANQELTPPPRRECMMIDGRFGCFYFVVGVSSPLKGTVSGDACIRCMQYLLARQSLPRHRHETEPPETQTQTRLTGCRVFLEPRLRILEEIPWCGRGTKQTPGQVPFLIFACLFPGHYCAPRIRLAVHRMQGQILMHFLSQKIKMGGMARYSYRNRGDPMASLT